MEALASRLPVLGTPVGGTIEILKAIDSKLLFDGTDPDSLADLIEDFLLNPTKYSSLSKVCRKKAVEQYSWERVVDRLEQAFYDSLNTQGV